MAFNLDDLFSLLDVKGKELERANNANIDIDERLASMDEERDKRKDDKISKIRKDSSDAYKATHVARSLYEMDYMKSRLVRETELKKRNNEMKEEAADRETEWEAFQSRESRSRAAIQQNMDMDSARVRRDRMHEVDAYKDLLDHKQRYRAADAQNQMMLMEKAKNARVDIANAETRKFNAHEASRRAGIEHALGWKEANEAYYAGGSGSRARGNGHGHGMIQF